MGLILLEPDLGTVMLMLPGDASMAEVETLRQQLGFNDPLYVQYWHFASRAVTGDLGVSLYHRVPAIHLIMERLPASLELAGAAMLIALVVAIPLVLILNPIIGPTGAFIASSASHVVGGVDHHVLRFEVAVERAALVGEVDRLGNRLRIPGCALR